MAKKSSFNLSAAVMDAVEKNPKLSGPEIFEILNKEQSGINKSSCSYAYSMARKKLGIAGKRGKRRKAGHASVVKRVAKPQNDTVSISSLKAAKLFLGSTKNDLDKAISLLRQYYELQK